MTRLLMRVLLRATLGLTLMGLVACAQYEEEIIDDVIILEEPAISDDPIQPDETTPKKAAECGAGDDGIGGTGCKAAETI